MAVIEKIAANRTSAASEEIWNTGAEKFLGGHCQRALMVPQEGKTDARRANKFPWHALVKLN